MNLIWSPEARQELRAVLDFVADHNRAAADRLLELIDACTERIRTHPFMYPPGRIAETREAVIHPNYI